MGPRADIYLQDRTRVRTGSKDIGRDRAVLRRKDPTSV